MADNQVSVYDPQDLAALVALMFRNPDPTGTSSADSFAAQLKPYFTLAQQYGQQFAKTMRAIGNFYARPEGPGLVDCAHVEVNNFLDAYNKAQAPPATIIGWNLPGYTISDQVTYLAGFILDRPDAEVVTEQLAALLLVGFRNTTDGNTPFASFQDQLDYYCELALGLPNDYPFRITILNIQQLYKTNPSVVNNAQKAIANMFTQMQAVSQQIGWGNCAYTSLDQVSLLGDFSIVQTFRAKSSSRGKAARSTK